MSSKTEQLKNEGSRTQVVIAGGVAGLVSRFCIAPLDVIKIRLQLQTHSLSDPLSHYGHKGPIYKGTMGTARAILEEEGMMALWKGNVPAEMLYVAFGAIQFSVYRNTSALLRQLPGGLRLSDGTESFISGAVAGGVATTATYPLDLLRTRFAAQGVERVYPSLLQSIREINAHEGPKGFFQGLTAAVMGIVPYMGLFFLSYETLKLPLAGMSLPIGSGDAVAGIMASIAAKTAVFPLDTVRKRLQVQGPTRSKYVHTNIPAYTGVLETLKRILRREGPRGLYRGLPVSLLKAAPASAITMWTYERTLLALRKTTNIRPNVSRPGRLGYAGVEAPRSKILPTLAIRRLSFGETAVLRLRSPLLFERSNRNMSTGKMDEVPLVWWRKNSAVMFGTSEALAKRIRQMWKSRDRGSSRCTTSEDKRTNEGMGRNICSMQLGSGVWLVSTHKLVFRGTMISDVVARGEIRSFHSSFGPTGVEKGASGGPEVNYDDK